MLYGIELPTSNVRYVYDHRMAHRQGYLSKPVATTRRGVFLITDVTDRLSNSHNDFIDLPILRALTCKY